MLWRSLPFRVAKVGVVGSNPIARSSFLTGNNRIRESRRKAAFVVYGPLPTSQKQAPWPGIDPSHATSTRSRAGPLPPDKGWSESNLLRKQDKVFGCCHFSKRQRLLKLFGKKLHQKPL
ncbi:hypothetical protein [Novacetimonas hansenii]|uniref:hypothetical protein n=1 Tax=Novacetimonas hansenii TaxID=436 RepID=UPI001FF0DFCC|nr:hypothetical protein [Novacetimonas hansenii]